MSRPRLIEIDAAFNVDKLLQPYERGGTEAQPVRRSVSTIATKLLHSYKFSPDTVGRAMFTTFWDMANNGLEFKGDGTYDSNGTQLFTHIRDLCVRLASDDAARSAVDSMMRAAACLNRDCPMRTQIFPKPKTKWQRLWAAMLKPRNLFGMKTWRL